MKTGARVLRLGVVAWLIACGSESGVPNGPDGAGLDSALDPDGPVFLSLDTNVNELTQGGSVRFSVIVTDPDGIDDVIGGVLKSMDLEISYGAFATSGQEGAYSLEISWADFNESEALEFDGEQERVFVAEFFDVAGHVARQSVTLRFYCGSDTSNEWACAGRCTQTHFNNSSCGSCGNECSSGFTCQQGHCAVAIQVSNRLSCNTICPGLSPNYTCQPVCGTQSIGLDSNDRGNNATGWVFDRSGSVDSFSSECDIVAPLTDQGDAYVATQCCCAE